MIETKNFDSLQINLASPKRIQEWGNYELPNGSTIGNITECISFNEISLKPNINGLYCERIFGPLNSFMCNCLNKSKKKKLQIGVICENCGIENTESRVRRYRMGFIKLLLPIAHIWYLKAKPSYISILLNYSLKTLEDIIFFKNYITLNSKPYTTIFNNSIKAENNLKLLKNLFINKTKIGSEAIKLLLETINLSNELIKNRLQLSLFKNNENDEGDILKQEKLIHRIRLIENFIATNSKPNWMILDILPVIPPDLRPILKLDSGKYSNSILNLLYTNIIESNEKLRILSNSYAYSYITYAEGISLQMAVDLLIDNGKSNKKNININNKNLKSLADLIKGKEGIFRQNLLGKRVDFSARSVIIVNPLLKLNQCGLPEIIALKLFEPFIIYRLLNKQLSKNEKSAKVLIKQKCLIVHKVLKEILKEHPILLNRAPTLHRLGIQSFEAILVSGFAIHLHPLVCNAFNADFDGDQMAVHLPLSIMSKEESKTKLLSSNNILSVANGNSSVSFTQDIILGCFYLTLNNFDLNCYKNYYFFNFKDAFLAYTEKKIFIHTPIKVRNNNFCIIKKINSLSDIELNRFTHKNYIFTTIGRIILNFSILESLQL